MKPATYKQGEKLGTIERVKSKHEMITDQIIAALESNTIPWKKPWNSLFPQNLVTKKEYRGINHFLLSMVPSQYPFFATFKQIKDQGGSVKKGAKAFPVYFYKFGIKEETIGTEREQKYCFMKQYSVFTLDQVEGIDASLFVDPVIDFQPILKAESLVESYLSSQKLEVKPAQNAAYFPQHDFLVMPAKDQFHSVDAYYSTIFHEMIHSTGSEKRLKRPGFDATSYHSKRSKNYAFEELVAEFGAAILASYTGVNTSLEADQSTAYIKNWLHVFKQDSTIAYKAASKAQQAVDFILKETGFNAFETDETSEVGDE